LTLEEEERLENSEPFPSQEIMKLHAARHELGHVLIDDSHSSKEDSTVDTGETTSEKPPVTTSR
jgi:predicted Zn-dependent protease